MQVNDAYGTGRSRLAIPTYLLIAVLLALTAMTVRLVSTPSPIMGSDEYAYLQTAHFDSEQKTLFALDPNMQRVDNKIVPWIYRISALVAPSHPEEVWRLGNVIAFCLAALLLFSIFRRQFGERAAGLAAALYLLMPFSFYATLLLPEVPFQIFVYLLVWLWTRADGPPPLWILSASAVLCGFGYLVKPHAAAAIVASLGFVVLMELRRPDRPLTTRLAHGALRAALFAALTYASMRILKHLLDPSADSAVISSFYASYLTRLLEPGYLWRHMVFIAGYAIAHAVVLLGFFAPGIALLGRKTIAGWRAPTAPLEGNSPVVLPTFVTLLAVSFIAMVALFTDAAASQDASEAYRLHGRYLSALLPFVAAFAVAGVASKRGHRLVGIVGLAAVLTVAWAANRWMRLYPWDYPDLFGLFFPMRGHWGFEGVKRWPALLVCFAAAVCYILYAIRGSRVAYVIFLCISLTCAHVQMSAWLRSQAAVSRSYIDEGHAIATYVSPAATGSGAIITKERWGNITYLLASLNSLQHVVVTDGKHVVRADNLPLNLDWIVVGPDIDVDFPGAARIQFKHHRLYVLGKGVRWPEIGDAAVWTGAPLTLALSNLPPGSHLIGFNEPEPWGAWSSDVTNSAVILPVEVSGRVSLSFFGWVADPQGGDVQIVLGDTTKTIRVGGTGGEYQMDLEVPKPSNRLVFRTVPIREDGGRRLGVAVARISLRR